MFTYQDFLNIFAFLKTGATANLDPNTLKLAQSEQANTKTFFAATIDQATFGSDDYNRLRNFLVDWYSSHRTIVSTQKNVSDIYSIPEAHLNELFYSFGFDVGDALKNLPYDNKIILFYDLVNLYKIKGTPLSIFKILNYFGVPAVELLEYWLVKDSSGQLAFKAEQVLSYPEGPGITSSNIDFDYVLNDPHWFLTRTEIENLISSQKLSLPSKTPYYGIRPTFSMDNIIATEAYLSRKSQDDYTTWSITHSLTRDINCSLGYVVAFLELYLGLIYAFNTYYAPEGHLIGDFLCYNNTTLETYEQILAEYQTLKKRANSRADFKDRMVVLRNLFDRNITTNFLSLYPGGAGELLAIIYPDFKAEIDYYFLASKEEEVVRLLFSDLGTWLRNNLDLIASSIVSYCLDFDTYSLNYVQKAIDFFKPYRARLQFVEKIFNIGTPLEDSCVCEDLGLVEITSEIYTEDYDTADSHSSFLEDSTSGDVYYCREHFDSGSYFDIGASIDIDPPIDISDEYLDHYNVHPSDSTAYVHSGYTLDSSSNVVYAFQDGGFVNYDEGWTYDSPFVSDILQITVIDDTPPNLDILFWRFDSSGGSFLLSSPDDYYPVGTTIQNINSSTVDTTYQVVGNSGLGMNGISWGQYWGIQTNNFLLSISDFLNHGQIAFWLNYISGPGGAEYTIMQDYQGSDPGNGFRLYFNAVGVATNIILKCNNLTVVGVGGPAPGGVHHYIIKWNFPTFDFYMDGVHAMTSTATSPLTMSGPSLYFGNTFGNPAQTCMDNLFITLDTSKDMYAHRNDLVYTP